MYIGYFKNVTKEESFKVLIINDIENPYPKQRNGIPIMPKEVQLGDNPFVVEYANDNSNLYKPYKCSTATVRLFTSNIPTDLLADEKNSVMVYLLKEKESVSLKIDRDGIYLYDEDTKRKLYQTTVDDDGVLKEGFDPEQEDKFRYTTEWVGYVTPNSYSQSFVRIKEYFELECQDALSSLQYFDVVKTDENVSFFDHITQQLQLIEGVYKEIYVTQSLITKVRETPILEAVVCQNQNWFDEDEKPMNALETIAELLKFLNVTVIPIKDKLYVVNYDAITSGFKAYQLYKSNVSSLYSLAGVPVNWSSSSVILPSSQLDISNWTLANAKTSISRSNSCRQVIVRNDEYYPEKLHDDINDFEEVSTWDNRQTYIRKVDEYHAGSAFSDPYYTYTSTNPLILNSGSILEPDGSTVKTYVYPKDLMMNGDSHIRTNLLANVTTVDGLFTTCGCTPVELFSSEIHDATFLSDMFANYNGSRMYLFHTPSLTKRDREGGNASSITPTYYYSIDNGGTWGNYPDSFIDARGEFDQPGFIQPMLEVCTKDSLLGSDGYLQLNGDWTFYATKHYPTESEFSASKNEALNSRFKFMFVWAKISVESENATLYLKNKINTATGVNLYEWTEDEVWCKLWYGGMGWNATRMEEDVAKSWGVKKVSYTSKNDAFENTFSFVKNTRAVDGTVVKLPENTGYGKVRVIFNRPVGCATENEWVNSITHRMYYASWTKLENLEVNIISEKDLDDRNNNKADQETDGEYKVTANPSAVDDFGEIVLKCSSSFDKVSNYSTVWLKDQSKFDILYNIGTDDRNIPEVVKIDAITHTYKQPNYMLTLSTHEVDDIEKILLNTTNWYNWFTYDFVLDNLSVNYSDDAVTLNLQSSLPTTSTPSVLYSNRVKNWKRNGDLLHIAVDQKDFRLLQPQRITVDGRFVRLGGNINWIEGVNDGVSDMALTYFEPQVDGGHMIVAMAADARLYIENNRLKIETL